MIKRRVCYPTHEVPHWKEIREANERRQLIEDLKALRPFERFELACFVRALLWLQAIHNAWTYAAAIVSGALPWRPS